MKIAVSVCAAIVAAAAASSSYAGLALSLTGPTPQNYTNGGGAGFGGVLGPATITFSSTSGNLDISTNITAGALGDNIVVIRLDTRNGGVGDFEMDDTADGGRRASSSPIRDGFLNEPTGPFVYSPGSGGGRSDFALAIGSFGSVLFELVPGNNLNFMQFNPAQNISIPFATLGGPTTVDWFAYYASNSGYGSNESLPSSTPFNTDPNPGFGPGSFTVNDFNRYLVPAPSAAALLGLGGLVAARRRR